MSTERTSRRLHLAAQKPDEVLNDTTSEWSDDEGSVAPLADPAWAAVDKEWAKSCMNKYVYFRWSTAFNSKNRFKGIVTGHRSRADESQRRIDFLTIKTFGYSEDRYRMGKDIRELFVLPNKTALMMPAQSEEELKARAVKRWSFKDGWIDMSGEQLGDDQSTQAETPAIIEPKAKQAKVATKPRKVVKPENITTKRPSKDLVVKDPVITKTPLRPGIHIVSQHSGKSMAGRLGSFAFFRMIN